MRAIVQDLRYTLRSLGSAPGLVIAVLLSLGLGIGATTSLFSIIDALDFRPLPYRDAARLVMLREVPPPAFTSCATCGTSFANYLDWRMQGRSFSAMAAERQYMRRWWHNDPAGGTTEFLITADVSPELFPLLATAPVLGRGIGAADATPGAEHVAVIADEFWRREFLADPHVIGRQMTFIPFGTDRRLSYTIVGVMPRGFRLLDAMAWMPLLPEPTSPRGDHSLEVIARLGPGVTLAGAQAEITTIAYRLAQQYPATNRGWGTSVEPLRTALARDFGPVGTGRFLLFGLVGAMVLIASANIATLLLARAERHYMDLAVRRALGASTGRLVTQSVLESGALAGGGGIIGIALAIPGVVVLVRGLGLDRIGIAAEVDGRVVTFGVMVAILVAVICAILPAQRAARVNIGSVLREHALILPGIRRATLQSALVTVEVAAALIVVTATALLSRDLFRVEHSELGFDAHALYHITARPSPASAMDANRLRQFASMATQRIAHIPGVREVSLFAPALARPELRLQDGTVLPLDARPLAVSVDSSFFRTARTPVIAGRSFTGANVAGGLTVVIVSKAAAESYWPGRNPIGSQVVLGDSANGTTATVVGVVANTKLLTALSLAAPPVIYRPFDQAPEQQMIVVARALAQTANIEFSLRTALRGIATGPIDQLDVSPMDHFVDAQLKQQHFNRLLLVAFGVLGLILAGLGVYGTVAYAVAQRSRELGIRMALGARALDVLALVSRDGMTAASLGILIGIPGSWAFGRVVQSLVVGTEPNDPLVLVSSALLVLALVGIAGYGSARRATLVDPCTALRAEA